MSMPPQPPYFGGMPPRPPKKGMSGCAIAAIVVVIAIVAVGALVAAAAVVVFVISENDSGSGVEASAPNTPTSSSPLPEYGVDATGEVVGEQCRVSGSDPLRFEVNVKIQNASTERAYKYTVDVTFTMAESQLGDPYWRQVKTVDITVAAGRNRKVVEHATADGPGQEVLLRLQHHAGGQELGSVTSAATFQTC